MCLGGGGGRGSTFKDVCSLAEKLRQVSVCCVTLLLLSLNRLLSNPPSPRLNHGLSLSLPSPPPPKKKTFHLFILCPPQITKLHAKSKLQSIKIDVPEIQAVSLLSVMTAETIFPDNAIRMVIVDVLIDLEM